MNRDVDLMEKAISLAEQCMPKDPTVPRVGAVLAVNDVIVGSAARDSAKDIAGDHAEHKALSQVVDKAGLPDAVLYTTLEPCTPEVRTKGESCCTELILQHKIRKVFIGILDPNQGVTGKGISKLQDHNVDVTLFPHELAQKIRAINADFIRSHQALGAKIISPQNGETLRTSTGGRKHPIRVQCLNEPNATTYLFISHEGLYWPQDGPFRPIEKGLWEVDGYFGALGDHALHVVTVSELGQILIEYFRKMVRLNGERRGRFKEKYNPSEEELRQLLGGGHFGITMTGLCKGLRSEHSITVTIE